MNPTMHLILSGTFFALAVVALLTQLIFGQRQLALILLMIGVAAGIAAAATMPSLPN